MKINKFYKECKKLDNLRIVRNYDVYSDNYMRVHAVFYMKLEIQSELVIKQVFNLIKKYKINYFILGNGSNVLFKKSKYKEVLLTFSFHPSKYLNIVKASDKINYLNSKFINVGIASLNFLSGVPASIGGAIYMNAGANNGEISEIVEHVYAYDLINNRFSVLTKNDCKFSYRHSAFSNNGFVILGAKIKLKYENVETIKKNHYLYLLKRNTKLPLNYPSLGSVFKNGNDYYAGALIDGLGLKGKKVGRAMVSYEHANVIVNLDKASGKNVYKLIKYLKKEVYKRKRIVLKEEIIIK